MASDVGALEFGKNGEAFEITVIITPIFTKSNANTNHISNVFLLIVESTHLPSYTDHNKCSDVKALAAQCAATAGNPN